MKSLFVITIKLNTLTDVPYQMTVGVAFVYDDRVIMESQYSLCRFSLCQHGVNFFCLYLLFTRLLKLQAK